MPVKLNNKGFSLVEILIGLGIMSIVMVGVGTQIIETVKMNVYLNQSQGFSQLSQEIASATKSSLLCSTFDFKLSPSQTFNMSQASTATGQDVMLSMTGGQVGNNSDLPNFGVSESQLKLSNVTALGLVNVNGEPLYQGLVRISGKRLNSTAAENSFRQKIISSVVFSIKDGQISGCYGNTQIPPIPCQVNPSTGQCNAIFPASAIHTCPAGSIATGYQGGILNCQQINETCPADQVVVAINNGKALCGTLPAPAAPPPPIVPNPGASQGATFSQYSMTLCGMVSGSFVPPAICTHYENLAALEANLGMPECTKPVLSEKCFSRKRFMVDGVEGGTSYLEKALTIYVGTPLY